MFPKIKNGYRVVWDLGFCLDYEDADEALDLYCRLSVLPAFQEDVRRPLVLSIKDGELRLT